jgi:hypothetical protein
MTQQERILEYLQTGKTITTLNAFNELGITRLASRIYDLKESGHLINKNMITVLNRYDEKCSVAEYSLGGSNAS